MIASVAGPCSPEAAETRLRGPSGIDSSTHEKIWVLVKTRWMLTTGIAVLVAACGGQSTITSAWKHVDSCLEQHPSFVGNVVAGKGGPGDTIDTLSVEGSGGALANAYRFPSGR